MMDLLAYFAPILKWRKLVIIASLIGGISTFFITMEQPSFYQAHTTLMVGQSINNPNPSSVQFYFEQELAKIYADMGMREPIQEATMEALNMNWLPNYIVRALPNSQLIEITVSDTNAARANAVATELANQLVMRTPTNLASQDEGRARFVDEQLTFLEEDIRNTQDEIITKGVQLGDIRGAQEIEDLARQIAALDQKLRMLQTSYANLLSTTETGALNTLMIIEPAEIPIQPTNPNQILSILLASILGASVAIAGAYLIEYLDQRVSHTSEITRLINWPILGEIEKFPEEQNTGSNVLEQTDSKATNSLRNLKTKLELAGYPVSNVMEQTDSIVTNSLRNLKTKLELAGFGDSLKTLLVSSPAASEGKSLIALNLAILFAKSQRGVVLIDGDGNKPQGYFFYKRGLSELLLEGGDPKDSLVSPYSYPLSILPQGKSLSEVSGILNIQNFAAILESLKEEADIIVIDGPPAFVSDSLVLAASADGVLPVIRLETSTKEAIRHMKKQFQSSDVNVVGIVVNGAPQKPNFFSSYYELYPVTHESTKKRGFFQNIRDRIWGKEDNPKVTETDDTTIRKET
jgi:capsular exopolysaccharide synthesis family protein